VSWVQQQLAKTKGPIVAATDYMKVHADQVRSFMPTDRPYVVLGTDGFGRSDSREALRQHFGVNAKQIAYAAMVALQQAGDVSIDDVLSARDAWQINPNQPNAATA